MNHEPECDFSKDCIRTDGWDAVVVDWHHSYDDKHCTGCNATCNCDVLYSAYQRGREDAAKDTKAEWDKPVWEYDPNVKLIDRLLAAARGESAE